MAESGNPLRIVVFGGIGSGKSTFAALLAEQGATLIEADRIGHEILRSDGSAFPAVSGRWPATLVDGEIDRAALAAIVFNDPQQLAELEAITHPLIGDEIRRRAEDAAAYPVIVELPLTTPIVEETWTWVLVDAPRDVRLQRAIERGVAASDAAARMAAQPDDDEWHARADWIIPNTGSLDELAEAAVDLWGNLLRG